VDQTNLANQPGPASTRIPGEQTEVEQDTKPSLGFVQRRLPWLVAGGVLLLYLLTLRRWITFLGLAPLARATGWDWHPTLHAPLQFLLTYPCRWLPAGLHVIGLNLFSAICATLSLALLARSVALLPHDRTRDQRQAERGAFSLLSIPAAWLPPLLAVLVCGLQMTFWEDAVVWTGESLDLLLFAYVVRCLLEYRLDPRDSWLMRLGFVCGLAVTNNFAMIAFLPVIGIALVWIKGLSLFNYRLCMRIGLFALAGLSLYLLLPIIHISTDLPNMSFWELLHLNVGFQKNAIVSSRRVIILMLSLTSVVPVCFMGIKWPASFGDISAAGNALTNLMTHVIHGVFLIFCLLVAFDPRFSPRALGYPTFHFLPFYYLGALSIGYCSGYFLLVFAPGQVRAWQRPGGLQKILNRAIVAAVWVAAIAAPAGLLYKNIPLLNANLGRGLSEYAAVATKTLPPGDAAVLSDELFLLYAVYGNLDQSGALKNKIMLESASLVSPYYHQYLSKRYPLRWPQLGERRNPLAPVEPGSVSRILAQLGQSMSLCYLQPSVGPYLDRFYLKPHGLVYELRSYSSNTLAAPLLAPEEIRDNDQFWQKLKTGDLKPLIESAKSMKRKDSVDFSLPIEAYYARAVDYFGVELQKAGDLNRAADCFGLALDLNPDSASAAINRDYNQKLRAGHPEPLKRGEEMEKCIGRYGGNWDALVRRDGPIDEPGSRNEIALGLDRAGHYRQVAQHLLRISTLTPTNVNARIGLASRCLQARMPDLALSYIADIRATEPKLHTADREALTATEAWAYVARKDVPTAEKILQETIAKYPLSDMPYSTLAEIYLHVGHLTNAMEVLDKELKAQPENSGVLNNCARLKIINNEFEPAIKLLDHALRLDPKNMLSLLNRAISNLKSGKLDDAQRDYQMLETSLPTVPYQVHFGLFDVAYKKKNPKTALKYGKLYAKGAPQGTAEFADVSERIKKVKSGAF